ncbi:MAG TPA: M23 family metallopeptidase [Vicinamibacterales bacterium]|nr:M23 family metallopeptidase [Vicinamibacterales bacterium]
MQIRRIAPLLVAVMAASCAREAAPVPASSGRDVVLPAEIEKIEAVVPRHATLDGLLRQHDIPAELVQAVIESARGVFNPRQLRADRPYRLVRSLDGWLREFEYEIDADRFLRIFTPDSSRPEILQAEVLPIEKETEVVAVRGHIDADHPSLVAAIDETGETIQLAMALAGIFSGQIDFESDLQQGDGFEVVFEKSTRDGEFAGYGEILGARFTNAGREHQAYRWVNPTTEKAGFYDENGRSLKRFFLASPLRFTPRVTSGFSRRRLHPVHRVYRAHLGVDYAAPYGAPVVAVASGVVVSAGWAGGGGRQVRIRHARGLESYYLHLSSFGKGIRAGARVEQGDVIGRVGATGTATGAHLDYRLRKNGLFVDPRREHARQPPGEPIPAIHLENFHLVREEILNRLSATVFADAAPESPDTARGDQ